MNLLGRETEGRSRLAVRKLPGVEDGLGAFMPLFREAVLGPAFTPGWAFGHPSRANHAMVAFRPTRPEGRA
jgi:hypothetical protein